MLLAGRPARDKPGCFAVLCSEFDVFFLFVQLAPVDADLPGSEGPRAGLGPCVPVTAGPVCGCLTSGPVLRGRGFPSTDLHTSPLQGGSWGLCWPHGKDVAAAPWGLGAHCLRRDFSEALCAQDPPGRLWTQATSSPGV